MTPPIYLTEDGRPVAGPLVRLSQVLDRYKVSLTPPLPEAHVIAALRDVTPGGENGGGYAN